MAVNITTNNNTVKVVTTPANKVKVVNNITNTSVTVSQPTPTQVVRVVTTGPQGPAGYIPSTGSFAITGSNTFIGNQTVSGSVNISGSLSTNNILYVTGSRVGIGTSAPTAILDVNGTSYLRGVALDGIFGYSGNNIAFSNAGNTTFIGNVFVGTTTNTGYKLLVTGSGTSGSLNVDGTLYVSGSRVGIGNTTPAYKLDIAGAARVTSGLVISAGQRLSLGGSDYGSDALYSTGGSPLDIKAYYYTRFTKENNTQGVQVIQVEGQALFKGSGATTSTTALRVENINASASLVVNDAGNVLVGTATDGGYRLDVNGTARVSLDTTLGTAATNSALNLNGLNRSQINFQINGATGWNLKYQSSDLFFNKSTDQFVIYDNQGSYFSNKLQVGGFVSYASSQTLRVSGSFAATTTGIIGASTQDASSQFQIDSTTKGFLPPRMTNAQRLLISTPAVGLMVYCTDATEGLYINKSTGWTFIA